MVEALTKQHGVARDRLTAMGVGMAAYREQRQRRGPRQEPARGAGEALILWCDAIDFAHRPDRTNWQATLGPRLLRL